MNPYGYKFNAELDPDPRLYLNEKNVNPDPRLLKDENNKLASKKQ
jgi:hypothetical protein